MSDINPIKSPPKYEQIRDHLANRISTGTLGVGDRLDSEDDLANRFAVARGTVRRAISDLERDGLVETIHGKGTFVRRLSSIPRTKMLSFITTDPEHDSFTNEFYFPILRAVEASARHNGMRVIFTSFSPEEVLADPEIFLSHVGDASIIVRLLPPSVAEILHGAHVPVVLVGNRAERSDIDSVVADNYRGAYQVTKHLVDLGHRRILHVEHDMRVATGPERRDGYFAALRDGGIEPDPQLIVACDSKNPQKLEHDLRELERNGVTYSAVFAGSDHRAILVMDYLRRIGRDVPSSVSVAGFDDLFVAGRAPYDITTASVDKEEMGRAAVELVLRRIAEPSVKAAIRVIPVSLVTRSSTARPSR